MTKLRRRDTDGLVAGHRVESDPGLDVVDTFLDAMRTEFGATAPPEPRPTLASTLDGRRPLRPASGPRVHTTFPERRPPRRVLRPVAAFAAAGVVLFGGLATAGALPGPVQRATADVTSHVGIHLPGRTEAKPEVRVQVDTGRHDTTKPTGPGATATTVPTAPATPAGPAPAPVPAPSAPTVPTVPSRPPPVPTTAPNLLGDALAPLAPTGPTGPEGPTAPHPVRNLLDQLIP